MLTISIVYFTVVFLFSVTIRGVPALSDNENGICGRMFIRNEPRELARLEHCRVIEGSLQIALIDKGTPEQYKNFSFPLREITGYLLLYNARGLQTLRYIFPNLTVIRGQEFIHNNYALIIYDMPDMQEIGLSSLTNILNGKVWIYNNQNLCYLETVDWTKITNDTHGNGLKKNKPADQCPNTCQKSCPKSDQGDHLCWSNEDCQKVQMKTCISDCVHDCEDCCSDQCLGGCTGPGPKECFVCKNVEYNGLCMSACPAGTFMYLNRRCVSGQECSSMNMSDPSSNKILSGKRLEDRECVMQCPKGYEEFVSSGITICRKCEGPCKKSCPGLMVDSVEASTQLKGCTRIQGSLKIQIRGYTANLASQLAENLDMIEEIDDFLVVTYTYSLLSLNFFTSLKTINGIKLDETHYALVVKSNENIGSLWNRTVKIKNSNARVLFHYNPKLCPQKIHEFVQQAGIRTPKDDRVDIGVTNGDKVPCNQKKLIVKIQKRSNSSVTIVWENFLRNLTEPSHLLNYEVSYKEAPHDVIVSPYDDRDPCGRDDWKVMDVPKMQHAVGAVENEPPWEEEKLINNLKYFTRYALYVKTVVIPDETSPNNNTGAESDVLYFITLPDEPSQPQNLQLTSNSSSEVVVTWFPPELPNGELEHYEIYTMSIPEDPVFQDQRNYCLDGKVPLSGSTVKLPEQSTTDSFINQIISGVSSESSVDCCSCDSSSRPRPPSEISKDVQEEGDIENSILNKVFIENPNPPRYDHDDNEVNSVHKKRRKKRGVEDNSADSDEVVFPGDSRVREEPTGRRPGSDFTLAHRLLTESAASPHKRMEFVLRNLTHYTRYKIGVIACRKKSPDIENDTRICSQMNVEPVQTRHLASADEISPNSISINVTGQVFRVHWDEPVHPNGVVLAYEMVVKRVDSTKTNEPVHKKCITRKDFHLKKSNFTFPETLHSGNYSFIVRTISLAAESNYTTEQFFIIEDTGSFTSIAYILLAIVLPIFIIIILGILLGFYYVKTRGLVISKLGFVTSANPDYIQNVDIPEEWEVPRDKVELRKELGQGSFGMVYEGILCDFIPGVSRLRCAVKTVARDAPSEDRARFLQEALIMTQLNTAHVVKLLGVISKTQPTFVVMELMTLGDLKQFLRARRPEECSSRSLSPPTLKEILRMAAEIADGMAYLDSHSLVHRDLAARNCMVTDNVTVKVGDFGMTKDVFETEYYRKATKGLLPVRWMAPESIRDGVFSNKSDCWSYGVVIWEMSTLAASPYQGFTNDQVLRFVRDGGVMERPEGCPNILYDIMTRCWQFDPRNRPTFVDIMDWLVAGVEPDFQQVSFYHSPKGIEYRSQVRSRPTQDELITQRTPLRATCESDDDLDIDDYTDDHDHDSFQYPYQGDSESGILLQDKPCNGALPRVAYLAGYHHPSTGSTLTTSATTVNNNLMENSNLIPAASGISNSPSFVSINLGDSVAAEIGNRSQKINNIELDSRQSCKVSNDVVVDGTSVANNVNPLECTLGQESAKVARGESSVNATVSFCPSNENSRGLNINYSSDESKYGNGGAPSIDGRGNGSESTAGPAGSSGANGYVALKRSPVTDNFNRTTPL